MKSGHSGAPVASLMLAGLFWLGGCGFAARAQASTSLPSSLPPQQTAWLEYRELSYPIANYPVSFTLQSAPFKKEPNLGGRAATRGIFKFGNNTEQFVSFILDRSQGKLYLDLNRNQDLTDDTHGVFTTTERGVGAYYQSFANIPLTFKTAVGTQPALVDLAIYHYGNPMTVQAGCRYCWEAKTSFQGRDYLLALADNLTGKLGSPEGGYLVLRPWAAGNQAFSVQNASLDGFPFARGLFFAGQTYHLDWSFLRRDGALGYKVELNPQVAELGELKLTGKYVNRLVLTRDSSPSLTVVLDSPAALEKVPRGVYHYGLTLKQGTAEAHRQIYVPSASRQIVVGGTNAAVLADGGPLTNSVTVTRGGKDLRLGYQLIGSGGQAYELQGQRKEPEFTIYRGEKQIASGKFQFG